MASKVMTAMVFSVAMVHAEEAGCADKYDYFAMGQNQVMAYKVDDEANHHQVVATWTAAGAKSFTWALNFRNGDGENRIGVTDESPFDAEACRLYVFNPCAQQPGNAALKLDVDPILLSAPGVRQPVGAQFDGIDNKIYVAMFKSGVTVVDPRNNYAVESYPYHGLHDSDPDNHCVHNVHVMPITKGPSGEHTTEVFINDLGNIWNAPKASTKGHGLVRFNRDAKAFERIINGDPDIHLRASQRDVADSTVIWGLTQEACNAAAPIAGHWSCEPSQVYKFVVRESAAAAGYAVDAQLVRTLPARARGEVSRAYAEQAGEGGADIISRMNGAATELIVTDRYGQSGLDQRPGRIYAWANEDVDQPPSVSLETGLHGNPRYTVVVKDKWVVVANNKASHGVDQPLAVYDYPMHDGKVAKAVPAPPEASFVLENKNIGTMLV